MAIAERYAYETLLFYEDALIHKSYNPSFDTAKYVIHWHFKKGQTDKGTIRNTVTNNVEVFLPEGKQMVSQNTGEILDECPGCVEWAVEKANLQRDIKAWQARYNTLKGEKEQEAMDSDEWEMAEVIFDVWRIQSNHSRSRFSFDRFQEIIPRLKEHGFELCVRAVAGLCFDPNSKDRKNGTKQVFNDIELAMRDQKHFEEYCRKAPLPWKLSNYTDRVYE